MLSRIKYPVLFSLCLIILISCGKKEEKTPIVLSADSSAALEKESLFKFAKTEIGDSIKVIDYGYFEEDSSFGLVAGKEFNSRNAFGIKFYYFKKINRQPQKVFESSLLNGSFAESQTSKMKLGERAYDVVYYDSKDYFLGSGGGEIFSYIIDLQNKQVFYAHFFTVPDKPTSLYLSSNVSGEVRDFFIRHFQRDYPGVSLVSKDYNLEDIF